MTTTPNSGTPQELLTSIKAQLPSVMPTTMTAVGPKPTAGNDLYEAYLFMLIVDAAVAVGYTVEYRTALGSASTLHLRRSPGRISSPGPGTLFTHALLTVGSRPPLEVHTGVVVVGNSKVVHEADVLVLPSDAAETCRLHDVDPPSGKALLVMEAKYYTQPVTLSTSREFLGLRKDLSAKKMAFVCTLSNATATALLAGTSTVEYDIGVLPGRVGENSLKVFVQRLLRDYKDRR